MVVTTRATDGASTESRVGDEDLAYTGPGTLAGRYLRRFWQPVWVARDLPPGHAKPIRIMSEDFTLYRGDGGVPHVVAFRCAHRGTQLSTGWVEGDCLRCFYHGWKYDGSGQCVEMPAEDPSFPPKVKIRSYPTEEYLGLIFAYLGEGAPPPLPRYPDLEVDGVREADSYFRQYNYFNAIDNDPVHVAFVHRNTYLATKEIPRIPRYQETEYGTVHDIAADGVTRSVHRLMPNMMLLNLPPRNPQDGGWWSMLTWLVPVDDESHINFRASVVYLTGEAAERYQERRATQQKTAETAPPELVERVLRGEMRADDVANPALRVLVQDDVVLLGQGRIADRTRERLGRSDVTVLLLRRIWLREMQALAEGRPLKQWRVPRGLAGPREA